MDEDIDLSDIPELGEEFFAKARRIGPLVQKNSVVVDRDIYEWFPEPECSKRISMVLHVYMERYRARLATAGQNQSIG